MAPHTLVTASVRVKRNLGAVRGTATPSPVDSARTSFPPALASGSREAIRPLTDGLAPPDQAWTGR